MARINLGQFYTVLTICGRHAEKDVVLTGRIMSKFAIASGHQLTSEAAADVLRAGGTAVDAAIAGAFMACVAEPVLASPLAGGFMMVSSKGAAPQCLDMFVQTPREKRSEADVDIREIEVDFGPTQQIFHCGAGTTATPGLVPGIFEAHSQFGRMPMAELVAPAVAAMRAGVIVTEFQAEVLGYVAAIYTASEGARELYCADDRLLKPGAVLRNAAMADVLEVMALEGARFVQEGEVASALLAMEGSHLTQLDLRRYAPKWRKPLTLSRGGLDFALNPPPSLGGVQIALALSALPQDADDRALAICLHEVTKIRKTRDLDHNPAEGTKLMLDPKLVKSLRAILADRQAATRGTTHISVIDQNGMGAAFTLSNGEGNGLIVPGTGIMANNMLGEDDLVPDGPNSWRPDQRLASMMCPMIARSGEEITMLGSGGSNRIRSALAQVSLALSQGVGLEEAIHAPRLHVETGEHLLDFEDFGDEQRREGLLSDFPDAKIWDRQSMYFGGVHAARADGRGGYQAVGDPRRSGHVLTE